MSVEGEPDKAGKHETGRRHRPRCACGEPLPPRRNAGPPKTRCYACETNDNRNRDRNRKREARRMRAGGGGDE